MTLFRLECALFGAACYLMGMLTLLVRVNGDKRLNWVALSLCATVAGVEWIILMRVASSHIAE